MPIHPLTGVATNNCYSIWGRFRTCIYCQQCCQHVSKSGLRKATVITGSQNSTVLSGPTLAKLGRTRFDLRSLYVTTGGALLSPINGAFIELIKSVYPFNDGWNLLYQSSLNGCLIQILHTLLNHIQLHSPVPRTVRACALTSWFI